MECTIGRVFKLETKSSGNVGKREMKGNGKVMTNLGVNGSTIKIKPLHIVLFSYFHKRWLNLLKYYEMCLVGVSVLAVYIFNIY